jgi:predicted transcriptional regulator
LAHRVDAIRPLLAEPADDPDRLSAVDTAIAKRLQQPRTTVDRVLKKLHALRLIDVEEAPLGDKGWRYFLAEDNDAATFALLVTRNAN